MREFLQEIKSELATEVRTLDVEALGRRMNVVGGPAEMAFPNNVGLLFFNVHPERFFPATQIDVVYFPDGAGGDRFEEKIFTGPLGQITRHALDYIARNYLKEVVIKHPDRPEAERFWNYPLAAIEEAVVNAVYHRSYEIREPVEVRITPQELVVLSFPGTDRSIRLPELPELQAGSRRYRNRRIGEFLKELDLTEGRSTGVPKILRVMQANGSPAPEFETDEERSHFLARLPVHAGFAATEAVTPEATPEMMRLLAALQGEMGRAELMAVLELKDEKHFRKHYQQAAIGLGPVEMTIPDKPRSPLQKYRLTDSGRQVLAGKDKNS